MKSGSGIDRSRDWSKHERELGYTPFPGTLNIRLRNRMPTIDRDKAILIYDYFVCVQGRINGVDCHFCVKKSMKEHGGIFVIAPDKLRDKLNLKDGDLVDLEWM